MNERLFIEYLFTLIANQIGWNWNKRKTEVHREKGSLVTFSRHQNTCQGQEKPLKRLNASPQLVEIMALRADFGSLMRLILTSALLNLSGNRQAECKSMSQMAKN